MSENLSLFVSQSADSRPTGEAPLAEKLRPKGWGDFFGLESLDKALIAHLKSGNGRPPSMILWGPPGSGKTTLAKLIGSCFDLTFVELSAVLAGLKEVREVVDLARRSPKQVLLFVDEIHRFNKAQQDAFLPHVEKGTIILVGATTENPSFYVNSALLSRMKLVTLPALSGEALAKVAARAEGALNLKVSAGARELACRFAAGDARRIINLYESLAVGSDASRAGREVSAEQMQSFLKDSSGLFYSREEEHYDMISAFIKSLRGSDPDAALFWGLRMLESGDDPRFIIRRMIIFACEDISNADPRALPLAVATLSAFETVGMPEGRIPIAQCITYLASAPKSNRSYLAMHAALEAIRRHPRVTVPLHLRNAPTGMMKSLGYGREYQYPHDYEGAHVAGVSYLPEELAQAGFYEPSDRGAEAVIQKRLRELKGTTGRS